jgi:tight adherence protein B
LHIAAPTFILGAISWLLLILWDRKKKASHPVLTVDKSLQALIHYDEYHLSSKEKVLAIIILGIPLSIIGYVFYKNLIMALMLSSLAILYPKYYREHIIRLRKNKLNVQFKQALSCL